MSEHQFRVLAVCSHVALWVSCPGAVAASSQLLSQGTIRETEIAISLPIFASSLCATAVFTWMVARYDSRRQNALEKLQKDLDELKESMKNGKSPE